MNNGQKTLAVIEAIHQAIKESGTDGIPSGHLYVALMEKMSLHTYQTIIDILCDAGKIKNTGHLLTSL